MKDDLKNILNNLNKDAGQEMLLQYLNRKTDDETSHLFEEQMIDDPFMDDAVMGLQEFKDKKDLSKLAAELNLNLKKQLEQKRQKKEKRKFKIQPITYIALITLLLLIIIAFVVINKFLHS